MVWYESVMAKLSKGFYKPCEKEETEVCIISNEYQTKSFFGYKTKKSRDAMDKREWERIGKFMGWY